MQNTDDFFLEQKNWSKRKLQLIRKYLVGFSKILGSSTKQSCVFYIDCFAGRGLYEDGSKGSPLLAAELAQEYLEEQKKYQLKCINIEANDENFKNLQMATKNYINVTENFFGSFTSNIDQIIQRINDCPAFFFIDPFGVKGTNWADMKKIINRRAATDLWLRFDYKTVRRLSGFFDSGSLGADNKFNRLLDLYGLSDANYLYEKLSGDLAEERIENAVNLYLEKLENELLSSKGFGYAAAFPIKSLEGENKYYLVFAAAHPKAVILASESVYSEERNRKNEMRQYQEKKTKQLSLFNEEPTEEDISKFIATELVPEILDLCKAETIDRKEIYMRLLKKNKKKWFGRFSGSQFNKALRILSLGQNPKIENKTGAISDDKTKFTFRL